MNTSSFPSPDEMYIFPTGNIVVFPGMLFSAILRRSDAVKRMFERVEKGAVVFTLPLENGLESLRDAELPIIGTTAIVRRMLVQSEGRLSVRLAGVSRASLASVREADGFWIATVKSLQYDLSVEEEEVEPDAYNRLEEYSKKDPMVRSYLLDHPGAQLMVGHLADFLAANTGLPLEHRKKALETLDPHKRLAFILDVIESKD